MELTKAPSHRGYPFGIHTYIHHIHVHTATRQERRQQPPSNHIERMLVSPPPRCLVPLPEVRETARRRVLVPRTTERSAPGPEAPPSGNEVEMTDLDLPRGRKHLPLCAFLYETCNGGQKVTVGPRRTYRSCTLNRVRVPRLAFAVLRILRPSSCLLCVLLALPVMRFYESMIPAIGEETLRH